MPRIRTIKPEFCTSEQLADCSTTSRLLFALMWMHCDDAGRHPASVKRLKMECFPADPFTDEDMRQWVDELIKAGLVYEYAWEKKNFWQVTGWHHQKIDKPSFRYPPLDRTNRPMGFVEASATGRLQVVDGHPPEPTGSLQESTSAAATVAAEVFARLDGEDVVRQANRLSKACRYLDREFVWQACVIGEALSPGMLSEIAGKVTSGEVKKAKGYIESALRGEAMKLGIDWRSLIPHVPAAPPAGSKMELEKVST